MSTKAQREIAHKLKVFAHAEQNRNVALTCRYFGISRNTFYRWKKNYKSKGEIGLVNSKPCPQNLKLRTPAVIEDKIIYLRQHYHFGQLRISWYLWRYHQIKISAAGAYHVLKRHGMNRLPQNQRKRSIPIPQRYKKQVPGHHVQVDVKFLFFKDQNGKQVKRYQYTAIDVDLKAKLAEWEAFYNYARPHAAMNGKTPYERLKEKLC